MPVRSALQSSGRQFAAWLRRPWRVRDAVTRLVRLRVDVVEVSGASMVPTLHHGDRLLAIRNCSVRPGDVVLAGFRDVPARLVVKRAAHPADGGWWLVSDNPFAGGDSATHGVADVSARVLWRVSSGLPRRIAGPPQ